MKILYIWDGTREELSNERDNGILSTLKAYPKNEVLVITRNKDFKCSPELKERAIYLDMDLLLKETQCKHKNHYSESDHLRWWYLSNYEDILYLDTDTRFIKPMPDNLDFGISRFDECMIYNGKNTDKCKEFYTKYGYKKNMYKSSVKEFGHEFPDFATDLTPYFEHWGYSSKLMLNHFKHLNKREKNERNKSTSNS